MVDFDAIRRGLAANLAALEDFQISPYLLDNPTPPTLQVGGASSIDYKQNYGAAERIQMIVEACLARGTDVGPQKLLDKLLAPDGPTSLREAVEADDQLTSRFNFDDGTVTADEDPACDALQLSAYHGAVRFTLENGTNVLLASWTVEILT